MPCRSGVQPSRTRDHAELPVRHLAGDQLDGQLAVARLEDVQRQRGAGHAARCSAGRAGSPPPGRHGSYGTTPPSAALAGSCRRRPALGGGRSTANASVTRSTLSANRNFAAGRPPARPGRAGATGRDEHAAAGEHPLQVGRRDRVSQRGGVQLAQRGDRELGGSQRETEVGVGQLGAQPAARRRGRSRRGRTRSAGSAATGCQPVSAGTSGSASQVTRPRNATASVRAPGTRSGSPNTASCSMCATSRRSTFSASWRRIEAATSSSPPQPAAGQRPAALVRRHRPLPQQHRTASPSRICITTARTSTFRLLSSLMFSIVRRKPGSSGRPHMTVTVPTARSERDVGRTRCASWRGRATR